MTTPHTDAMSNHREATLARLRDFEGTYVAAAALTLWENFDENERAGVRLGLFPADPMKQAEADAREMWQPFTAAYGETFPHDFGQRLAVALMDQAKRNGGMIA